MTLPHLDLEIKQGEDWDMEFGMKDENGLPSPITGWEVRMQIRTRPGGEIMADLSSPSNGIVVDTVNSKINFSIPEATTKTFSLRRYEYDIRVVTATPKTSFLVSGNVLVEPSITVV
ncbi:MAG: hypothetical protein ABFD24_06170 [Anaerolineaceae bacterium]